MFNKYCTGGEWFPTHKSENKTKTPPSNNGGGISALIRSVLHGMDKGDVILVLIILLLYIDSGDDDYLIILAALFAGNG